MLVAGLLYLPLYGQPAAKSPFIGTWSTKLPEYGWVALSVGDNGRGQINGANLWWFVELLDRGFSTKVEGSRLYLQLHNHNRQPIPCLTFEMTTEGKLKLLPGGFIPDPVPAPFESLTLERNQKMFFWHELTSFKIDKSEYNKWHHQGSLKELPETWPTAMAVTTGRLFALDDHLLHQVLALPSLPDSFLAEVHGWALEKPSWNESPEYIMQAIARNPNCGQPTLGKIWQHPDNPHLWLAVAANRNAQPEWSATVVDRIIKSDDRLKSRATRDGSGPPELYQRLIQDGPKSRGELTSSRRMPAFVYETLARDFPETRATIANNEAAPATLINELAAKDDTKLWRILIHNRQLTPDNRSRLVVKISLTATVKDIKWLARDRDTPPELLSHYVDDLDPAVRTSVANNPQTDQETLLRLVTDEARETARTARDVLRKRFPSSMAQVAKTLVPLESLEVDCSPVQRFRLAVARSDLKELARLAEYLRPRDELESVLQATADDLIKAYRPTVMDFFIAEGYNKYPVALTDLAARCGGDQQWLTYFKAHGAFEGSLPGRAYAVAIETGHIENVTGLIKAGIDVNKGDGNSRTALHIAVIRRNITLASLLLNAGAKIDIRDHTGRTALDYAVLGKLIPAIKLLDRENKYSAIVEEFTKEFPAAPKDSPFLGRWTNNGDGFDTVIVRFESDGTGYLSGGITTMLVAWHATSGNEAVAFLFNEKGELERSQPLRLILDPAANQLTLEPQKGEKQTMRRMEAKP